MKKIETKLFVTFICFFSFNVNAQERIEFNIKDLNGIWRNTVDTVQYVIFKKGKSICFSFDINSNIYNQASYDPFDWCGVNTYSFVAKSDTMWLKEKKTGNSNKDFFLWGISYEFYFENINEINGSIELSSSNVFNFKRIKTLPNFSFKGIYQQGKRDKRDYLEEFLDKNFNEISILKSKIYTSPAIATKMYLVKGDEIEILQIKNQWLKIRYYGNKTIEGWIKKSDVYNP